MIFTAILPQDLRTTATPQFTGLGVGTASPIVSVHVQNNDLSVTTSMLSNTDYCYLGESNNAVLGLFSLDDGQHSSAVDLGEVNGGGTFLDKWAIVKQTYTSGSSLLFSYSTTYSYGDLPDEQLELTNTGDVHLIRPDGQLNVGADSSFSGFDERVNILGGNILMWGSATRDTELVTNGDMETGDPPSNWTTAGDAIASRETSPHGGTYCIGVSTATGGLSNRIHQNISTTTGELYEITVWAKTDADGIAYLALEDETNGGYVIAEETIRATGWTKWNKFFVATAGNPTLQIRLAAYANVKAYFDDVSVKKVLGGQSILGYNFGIGQTTFGTNAVNVFALATNTAPSSSPADCFQMYSADFNGTAGQACPHFRTETGTIARLNQDVSTLGTPSFSGITTTGKLSLPTTSSSSVGVIEQNSVRIYHAYGTNNYFAGTNAGNFTTTGQKNTGVGANIFQNLTTGNYNVAIGPDALNAVTSGSSNVGIGNTALLTLQGGTSNVAIGSASLYTELSGGSNVAIGDNSMNKHQSGDSNVAIGAASLYNCTTGQYNVAIGSVSLYTITTASFNVAIGREALRLSTSTGINTAVGAYASYSNTTGSDNVSIGEKAGYSNQTGSSNVFIGHDSGYNETGSNKLYISNSNTASPLIYGNFSTPQLTINGGLKIADNYNIIFDTTNGTQIGTATSQLLAFYGTTPVNQPDTVSDASTQDLTGTDTIDQTKLESDLSGIVTAVNTVIDRLQELGLIA